MNIKNTMLKITTVVAVVFSFVACEDDFETVGSGVIGDPGFTADLYEDAEIKTTVNDLAPVQTNNLPAYLLGVYRDQLFGKQTASILANLTLSRANPDFGTEPVIDSVVLSIPYFSHTVETEDDEVKYELDSVYGTAPFKLSLIETNFYLNSFDPETNFEQSQKYFSNLDPQIQNNLTSNILYQNESFIPSPDPVIEVFTNAEGEEDTVSHSPRMRLLLDNSFFQNRILNKQGSSELASQNNFRNYLRSIYFKAEATGNNGSMMLLDLANEETGITIYYKSKVVDANDQDDDGDETELIDRPATFNLVMGASRVNTFEQEVPDFNDAENLYLKGGEGSMAIIELFSGPDSDSDGISDELEAIRENNWLVNEANLEFFVNREFMAGMNEPERIYLYDLTNNRMLADYVLDAQGQLNALTSTSNKVHLGPLKKDENGRGISYKIKITRFINNLLNNDTKNVKLGLVVTQNVNAVSNSAVLQTAEAQVKRVPVGSVITPEATVLYGPEAEDEDKRLKLRIYYTEPKN